MLGALLLFCAGVRPEWLEEEEVYKYQALGATFFVTCGFSAVSAGYASFWIFRSVPAAYVIACAWAAAIFLTDRAVVLTMSGVERYWLAALPRLFLGLVISIVVAAPLELRSFEREINREIYEADKGNLRDFGTSLDAEYAPRLDDLAAQAEALRQARAAKAADCATRSVEHIREAEGSAGTLKRGVGPIAELKRSWWQQCQDELAALDAKSKPELADLAAARARLETEKQAQLQKRQAVLADSDGLLARLDALGRLRARSAYVLYGSLFLSLIFVSFELIPMGVKFAMRNLPCEERTRQAYRDAKFKRRERSAFEQAAIQAMLGRVRFKDSFKRQMRVAEDEASATFAAAVRRAFRPARAAAPRRDGRAGRPAAAAPPSLDN
jgi:hypothetical protein